MTQQTRSQTPLGSHGHSRRWQKLFTLLGLGLCASSLALFSPAAQGQSNGTPYCFSIRTAVDVYDSPSFGATKIADYISGDTAYATTNPPTSVWVNDGTRDGNSFIKVAIYGGNVGWVPRYLAGSDVTVLTDQQGFSNCPSPMPPAAGS
ncbi:MAG: hypothetical protein AAF827_16245 [Cyanobacteria bacterium P01_D01_bin.6]